MKTMLTVLLAWVVFAGERTEACCALTISGRAAVNADQSVIMVWDEERRVQHFVREASFATDAADVGFIVPVPTRPELAESGSEAFPLLRTITAPEPSRSGFPLGCAAMPQTRAYGAAVRVLEEKRVAGYDATVLQADSGRALADWLKRRGYPFSDAVADWAAPYVRDGWCFAAMQVAKDRKEGEEKGGRLAASSLRLSFRTERPLFPYREPASAAAAAALGETTRLLRIDFIAKGPMRAVCGSDEAPWRGRVMWSGDISRHRQELLRALRLPDDTLTGRWWLTTFEDRWPWVQAPGDVWFQPDPRGRRVRRTAVAAGGDAAVPLWMAAALVLGARRRAGKRGAVTQP